MYERKNIPIEKLELNVGQIPGVPANPRRITSAKMEKLIDSIDENREMLELRELLVYPLEDKYIVIGGNMRLRALQALEAESVPCKVLSPTIPAENLREYAIKDNVEAGEWDLQLLEDFKLSKSDLELLDVKIEAEKEDILPEIKATEVKPFSKIHVLITTTLDQYVKLQGTLREWAKNEQIDIKDTVN